jgi:hypothetical protein
MRTGERGDGEDEKNGTGETVDASEHGRPPGHSAQKEYGDGGRMDEGVL